VFPASTKGGGAVLAFPDVCKTPGALTVPGPVPIPYPNQASIGQSKTTTKVKGAAAGGHKSSFAKSVGNEPGTLKGVVSSRAAAVSQFRTHLQTLHSQLAALPPGNPNRWHELVDDYVVTTAKLYIALTDR